MLLRLRLLFLESRMYLKRLEIKGFKSFADSTVINLEPGISAIVGPNGSGKSNICDAILWVLGERNAKSLRGSVMEDVIFAGSASRPPVNFAEVSLVLDNSDGAIPINFKDLSVSRRLYRSGESEYLINGSIARRLDVLDILHDSGLGSDTNSIISQGQLDSILQSKPEDRRSLIEEAAGVLKHKQRKNRSLHKIDKMNQNLRRIEDVMAEIERSLKPLRIKAKRAKAYGDLQEKLRKYNIALCVDDLRNIKDKYSRIEKEKSDYGSKLDSINKEIKDCKDDLDKESSNFSTQNKLVVEHANKSSRYNSCIDKFDAYIYVLNNKAQQVKALIDDYDDNYKNNDPEFKQQFSELENLKSSFSDMKKEYESIKIDIEKAKNSYDEVNDKKSNLQTDYDKISGILQGKQSKINSLRSSIDSVRDSVFEAQSKMEISKSKCNALSSEIEHANNVLKVENEASIKLKNSCDKINEEIKECRDKKDSKTLELDSLKKESESLADDLSSIDAEILSINKILERNLDDSNPAYSWLDKNHDKKYCCIDDEIEVDDKYFDITERILGNFAQALITDSAKEAIGIKDKLDDTLDNYGYLSLVYGVKNKKFRKRIKKVHDYASDYNGVCLIDYIESEDLSALNILSNVVIFDNIDDALFAQKENKKFIIATLDGLIIYPDNKIDIFKNLKPSDDSNSDNKTAFAYKRDLKKLKKTKNIISKKFNDIQGKLQDLYQVVEQYNIKISDLDHSLAKLNSDLKINLDRINQYNDLVKEKTKDLEEAKNEYSDLKKAYSACAPQISQYKLDLKDLELSIKKDIEKQNKIKPNLNEAMSTLDDLNSKINTLMVKKISQKEKINHTKINMDNISDKIDDLKKDSIIKKDDYSKNLVIYKRAKSLAGHFSILLNSAKRDLDKLNLESGDVDGIVKKIQDRQNQLMNTVNSLQVKRDECKENISKCSVELAKLEVGTQNVLDALDSIDNISVDSALNEPVLENREEIEVAASKLKKRLLNMGIVSPDSIKEYEELKERYDYFVEAVDDLKLASKSLNKITKIIDNKIRDSFVDTYYTVNDNFQEIFKILFPGGSAHLELENEDDIDNSGVEVVAQPNGKQISKMSLMSGGEKSLVALCLLFAVYKTRSTPFYILDEVEAALDDTNLQRLIKYLCELKEITQLIMITHQRRSMEMASVLYGVSMKNDGVTKVVRQKLEK